MQIDKIRAMSSDPLDVEVAEPRAQLQPTEARDPDGRVSELPLYERHLLCNAAGMFPVQFSSDWEAPVLQAELQRADSVAWYRNPGHTSPESVGVVYEDGSELKILRPDFVFFAQLPSGEVVADIVDPHGFHLADALPKLKGLADYAEKHGEHYRRVEAVAKIGSVYRVLDLTDHATRAEIRKASGAEAAYRSGVAHDYSV